MPDGMLSDFVFIPHLATLALAVNQFSQSSNCSPSFPILATILVSLSLLPFIHASALFVKISLVGSLSRVHSALACIELSDEDIRTLSRYVSEERCPGHLDSSPYRELPSEASLPDDLSQESAASSQPLSAQFKGNETNHRDAALLADPHVLARARCSHVGETLRSNACPAIPPASDRLIPPRDTVPAHRQLVDLELSAVGQYLARRYGMFVWRIHPLIRAHNGFAGLDASFRRLDMFMHSARAGMLYHELIIFVDHTAVAQALSGEGQPQATWQMYAARTQACDLSDPSHACFRSVDRDGCDSTEEWQNCLQWDALMARVLNTAYMRRVRETMVQRWDGDAREYWRRGEGLSDAMADRVAKAVLAYGFEAPAELAFEDGVSSGSDVNRGIQNCTRPKAIYEREEEYSLFKDDFGCVIDLSSCGPDCQCGWGEDASDQGAEVDNTLYDFDFEEELRAPDWDVERDFKRDSRGFDSPNFDFGSLDSILSDATPPPASLTPSSSERSSCDMDSDWILYPRLMPSCSSTLIPHESNSQFLRLGPTAGTRIHPTAIEESPTFATSSSSERILADFSAMSLSLSGRTSTSMNILDGESLLSSSPKAASGFTPQPVEARMHEPSLLELALALGTRDSEERLRKRELTSSSSYPSPPPSPSSQLPEDICPQVPEVVVASSTVPQSRYKYSPSPSPFSVFVARDTDRILPHATPASHVELAPASERNSSLDPAEEMISDPLCTGMDSDAPSARGTQTPLSARKLRVTLNLTIKGPPSCIPSASLASVMEPAVPAVRTAFSLWDAIMRPQAAPAQSSCSSLAGVDLPASDPNSNIRTPVDCDRKAACGQTDFLDELPGFCTPGAGADEFLPDTSNGEWERVRTVKKTRRGGEKARRQRERRRMRIEMAQAWETEWSALAGMACLDSEEGGTREGQRVRG